MMKFSSLARGGDSKIVVSVTTEMNKWTCPKKCYKFIPNYETS
jgi:hypothetical protein